MKNVQNNISNEPVIKYTNLSVETDEYGTFGINTESDNIIPINISSQSSYTYGFFIHRISKTYIAVRVYNVGSAENLQIVKNTKVDVILIAVYLNHSDYNIYNDLDVLNKGKAYRFYTELEKDVLTQIKIDVPENIDISFIPIVKYSYESNSYDVYALVDVYQCFIENSTLKLTTILQANKTGTYAFTVTFIKRADDFELN